MANCFPQLAVLLESHVTLIGPVERWVADYANHTSQESWFINAAGAKLSLHFATPPRPDTRTSATVPHYGLGAGFSAGLKQGI